jgi:hypothetical protein
VVVVGKIKEENTSFHPKEIFSHNILKDMFNLYAILHRNKDIYVCDSRE